MQVHPELNTQGIALSDLTQRLQVGQKHKLSVGTSMKITAAKKRIKLEQNSLCPPAPVPVPKSANPGSVKLESDNSDYSHTTDDKPPNIVDMDYNKIATPIKSEPTDVYETQLAKKKM